MDKKILVAFDDSDNAMRAVEYVAKNFAPDNKITLLNIVQDTATLCDMNSPELTPYFKSQQKSFCTLEEKKKGVARDIVKETQSGYHTIIMGRRGQSEIKEFILGSISQKVFHLVKDISVLVVN